jgi:predicted nucleotidyltransferase
MGKREVIKKLRQYKLLVSSHFDIDKVVLFGSFAKGTQRTDSDIDVAIVVNSINSDFFTYAPLLWKLRLEIDNRIEPVLLINGKDESGFLQEILQTGLIIS